MSVFTCLNCGKNITGPPIGTKERNHCPFCLWSLHLDNTTPGDRLSRCSGLMKPVGLSCKSNKNKYQPAGLGELMVVHQCQRCNKWSKNRIAGDDDPEAIIALLNQKGSENCPWKLLGHRSTNQVEHQLFGTKLPS